MQPRVLVTRPQGAADATIRRLSEMDLMAVHVPLLRVEPVASKTPQGTFDGMILTSAQAATQSLIDWLKTHPAPAVVLVTGEATARAARQIGLGALENVEGGALDIVERVRRQGQSGLRFLYPCAERTAHDLPALLAEADVTCEAWPVYRSVEADALPPGIIEELADGSLSHVLLYSPRTAQAFARLAPDLAANVELLCLSEAVARATGAIGRGRSRFPQNPTEKALLRLMMEPESGQRL